MQMIMMMMVTMMMMLMMVSLFSFFSSSTSTYGVSNAVYALVAEVTCTSHKASNKLYNVQTHTR